MEDTNGHMAIGKSVFFSWDYSHSDILNIHKVGKQVAGSAEIGDFTVDFDKEGGVVGVEITNASDFFSHVGISREQLESLQDVEFALTKKNNGVIFIWITLKLTTGEQTVPLPAPIAASVEA